MEGVNLNNEKEIKIAKLRQEIARAEEREDEARVLLLEAELRAVESGKFFDKEGYIKELNVKKGRAKKDVLRDMHDLAYDVSGYRGTDFWNYDGLNDAIEGTLYEDTFFNLLHEQGIEVESFNDLTYKIFRRTGRKVNVLDLFGGAYFIDDLSCVQNFDGVRIKDVDRELALHNPDDKKLQRLVNSHKRRIIQGDLYRGETWKKLQKASSAFDVPGYNLIVCRPQGFFWQAQDPVRAKSLRGKLETPTILDVKDSGHTREDIFISLLERSLALLSTDGGFLFSQVPKFGTDIEVVKKFWRDYVERKQREGYKFYFGEGNVYPTQDIFAVEKISQK